MRHKLDQNKDINVLRIEEQRLDSNVAPSLKAELLKLYDEEASKVLIDLGGVDYADSSGLGAILLGIRQATDNGGACKLVNVNTRVLSLIKIARLDHIIEAFDDESEAIASFQG